MNPFSLYELIPAAPTITIIDIGAALAEKPNYDGLINAGRARLVGFEPNAAECAKLNARYGEPHRFFPCFVGDGGEATFHETNWTLTGSLYEPNTPLLEKFQALAEVVTPKAQHRIQTRRLDDIAEIDDADLIKIDVQGAELAVFRNASRLLGKALLVQTEVEFVEIYKNQPLFADVDGHLRGAGFQFHGFAGFGARAFKPLLRDNNPYVGFRQMLWADVWYVRDWMRFDLLDEAKLMKFAVLLHDVVGSFDLCHLVLEELERRGAPGLAGRYRERLVQ